ncbi:hypothetical protein ACJRO7_016992 [Eucalyptus globulus]|uniref:Pentatricopeptide repeat-containing protein n=1 Tax=Eucalyptus globulus TaxID=34317 RepID=A0ABD3KQ10_EUCGL
MKSLTQNQFAGVPRRRFLSRLLCAAAPLERDNEIDRITKIINDRPFPYSPLQPVLQKHIPPHTLSTGLVEDVLGHLFGVHSNGLKALEFFRYTVRHSLCGPTSVLTLKAISIMILKIAKFKSDEDTSWHLKRRRMMCLLEGNLMHSRFSLDTKTMNILLLGFKESGDVNSVELFYHEMVRRGFKPNTVTYNIRIDAYCKRGCVGDGLRLLEGMEGVGCLPTELFDGIITRNMQPDIAAYNAMISALIKAKYVNAAIALMDEMKTKHIGHDNMTYHTLFFGLMRSKEIDGVCELYHKMVERNFVPKTQTVVMLMKYFGINGQVDLRLQLWEYLVGKGHCPHGHALDLLVIGLRSRGRELEAFECSKQMLERGTLMTEATFQMLGGKLNEMVKKLKVFLPLSKGHANGITNSSAFNVERIFLT